MMSSNNPFTLFFGGAEVPGWRNVLVEGGAHGVSLTYWNLRRRLPKRKEWKLAEYMPAGPLVLVESGAYTANKDPGQFDRDGWLEYDQQYRQFVLDNIDRIDLVTEFDSLILGEEYIEKGRKEFWSQIPVSKFMPVWHSQFGIDELEQLAGEYDHVAIPSASVTSSTRVPAKINNLTQRFGTEFHGAALTKPDILLNVRFASAASTSWLSPVQYGDTIVWDGTKLRRYPKKYKDQARKRHRMLFQRAGFDPIKIEEGEPNEVARFSVWSWLQLEDAVARRRHGRPFDVIEGGGQPAEDGQAVTGWAEEDDEDTAQERAGSVARHPSVVRNTPVARQERHILPVFTYDTPAEGQEGPEGTKVVLGLAKPQRASLRHCDNCFVSGSCPAFEAGSECAYDLPLEVRTREQMVSLLHGVIEMQAQRVAFARFAEELEGGYPDPNVSSEIERLFKITQAMKEITDNRETLDISVRAKAGAGYISRIFGGGGDVPELPTGGLDRVETDRLLGNIVDAEVVEDPVTR